MTHRAPAPHRSALPRPSALPAEDLAALEDLYLRGTPETTLRAYERDLAYIAAWKRLRENAALAWPETEQVALRFVLDHSRDLNLAPGLDPARRVAEGLIDLGLRRSLDCPAAATLDRRIASWRVFHRMRNLASPFEAPLVKAARGKARRAAARPRKPKSRHPITRRILETLLATCQGSNRDCRDRALLMLGWASGGRRRSELVGLDREDIDLRDFASAETIWIRLRASKTTRPGESARLLVKGRAARALMHWIDLAAIVDGPLFRPVSKSDRVLPRRMAAAAVQTIIRARLQLAGLPEDFASPHGLRSGFLTQAALDGAPLQAAMRLSLHRSAAQAMRYYDDVTLGDNPATELLE